jgi:Transcriptional regulatory protein, C terminal
VSSGRRPRPAAIRSVRCVGEFELAGAVRLQEGAAAGVDAGEDVRGEPERRRVAVDRGHARRRVRDRVAAELLARIEAVLRRAASKSSLKEVGEDSVARIDFTASEVIVHGDAVSLTPLEFRLLATLAEHAGQVLSRDQLLELVWGDPSHRTGDEVKLYIGYLRRKIEVDPSKPELIETVRGFGYRHRRR